MTIEGNALAGRGTPVAQGIEVENNGSPPRMAPQRKTVSRVGNGLAGVEGLKQRGGALGNIFDALRDNPVMNFDNLALN